MPAGQALFSIRREGNNPAHRRDRSDALANRRSLKCLTAVDDFTRECVDITVDHGVSGAYVVRILDQAARFHGHPKAVRTAAAGALRLLSSQPITRSTRSKAKYPSNPDSGSRRYGDWGQVKLRN